MRKKKCSFQDLVKLEYRLKVKKQWAAEVFGRFPARTDIPVEDQI